MTTDWHASYLTDRVVMEAARRRALETGCDGWAAAAELAPVMAPGISSLAAIGARAVLAPGADALTDVEEDYLEDASTAGYYNNPNLSVGNPDMAASMTRTTSRATVVRPDLDCPACCTKAGRGEEAGVQRQVYRCTECHELWEYVPSVAPDVYATNFAPVDMSPWALASDRVRVCDCCGGDSAGNVVITTPRRVPSVLHHGGYPPVLGQTMHHSVTVGVNQGQDGAEWTPSDPAEMFRSASERMAEEIARMFGIPPGVIGGRIFHEELSAGARPNGLVSDRWWVDESCTGEQAAKLELYDLLVAVRAGQVLATRASEQPGIEEARRRRLELNRLRREFRVRTPR